MTKNIGGKVSWTSGATLLLGENPIWDARSEALYFIDAADPGIFRVKDGKEFRYSIPKPVASIFLAEPSRLVVAMRNSFANLDLDTGALSPIAGISPPGEEERFNDGRCDANGRIWISTMDRKVHAEIGTISLIRADFRQSSFVTGAALGNGVCFSPDSRWMYFSDTSKRAIYRYALPSDSAEIGAMNSSRELFVQLDDFAGRPDGCSVDNEGCLWSARVGGGRIDRYSPSGELVGYLETPFSHPTHCTFGGPDMRTLFVTSSRYPQGAPDFASQPLAGKVIAFEVDAQGLPESIFNAIDGVAT